MPTNVRDVSKEQKNIYQFSVLHVSKDERNKSPASFFHQGRRHRDHENEINNSINF